MQNKKQQLLLDMGWRIGSKLGKEYIKAVFCHPAYLTYSQSCCCYCFGSISSFFLELFLHWFPLAYWAPTDLGSSSFSVLSFCLFIMFMGFSRQEYWSGIPFFSGPCFVRTLHHDLSILSGMAHRFTELDKAIEKWSHSVVSNFLRPHGLYPARLLCPWNSPGKNTGVGCHFLLQGIFPTQGLNLGPPALRGESLPPAPHVNKRN